MINRAIIEGNIVSDAVLRSTAKGDSFMTFSLAGDVWGGKYVNFIDVSMFGDRAKEICGLLTQGTHVIAEGKIKYVSWEKDGVKRGKHELRADDISFFEGKEDAVEEQEMADRDIDF